MSEAASPIHTRLYRDGDYPFLCAMCYEAIYWHPNTARLSPEETFANPSLGHYILGWGRAGDTAILAETDDGAPGTLPHPLPCVPGGTRSRVGAAWYRFFPSDDPGYGFLGADIPEVSIGIAPEWRGKGIGRLLLDALRVEARHQGIPALSLSVAKANATAFRLYQGCGFTVAGDDGDSWIMRLDL